MLVYLTLLETIPLKTVELKTEYLDHYTMNVQSFGSSLICVVSDIEKKGKISLKLYIQLKTTYFWVVDLVFLLVTFFGCNCWAR